MGDEGALSRYRGFERGGGDEGSLGEGRDGVTSAEC